MPRRLHIWVLLPVLLGALALAPAALADGAAVEIDNVAGQIYDVDAGRILFRQSATAFGVKDRVTGDVTSLTTPPYHVPRGGFLTSHGALLVSETGQDAQLQEWRDGSTINLGEIYVGTSLRVAGNYALWNNEGVLTRRDLATGTNDLVSSSAALNQNDVAPNGDVAYYTDSYVVSRFRAGTSTTLGTGSDSKPQDLPLTDGFNVVWRETGPHCCGAPGFGDLHAYGASAAFNLGDTQRNYSPSPGADYRLAGGWTAFTRGNAGATEVWLRDPFGDTTQVSNAGSNRIAGLAPNGEVVYVNTAAGTDNFFLRRPGDADSTALTQAPAGEGPDGQRGYDDHAFFLGGNWYGVVGNSLRRLAPDQTADGARTEITDAPDADSPSHVSVSFASKLTDTEFQCKLDAGAYVDCDSPVDYTSLQHGRHTVAVRAVVAPGQFEADPAVASWTVDSDPPAVTLTSGPNGVTGDATPTFGGAAGNAAEDETEVTLRIYQAEFPFGTPLRTVHATRTGATWSATVGSALPNGDYTARAEQSDAPGNVRTTDSRTFTVDSAAPTARLNVTPSPAVTDQTVTFDAGPSNDLEGPIVRYEWDLDGDGDFERDTGADSDTTRSYANTRRLDVAVRVTDDAGNTATATEDLTIAPEPPSGLRGVTINDGDRFTNDPNVFVQPVWPPGATHIFLSNDGGFGDAVKTPLANDVPWRLDSSGPERLPKTIYVRFFPNGTTYQDDIILDETAPSVLLAEFTDTSAVSGAAVAKRTYHLHVKARDRTAGVSRMQITTNRKHPGEVRRFRNRPTFTASTSKIFVRVRDRAGNWSRWKRFTR